MEEIRWLSAVEQGRLLQCGQLSATELRRSVTETIDRLNPVVNAVVVSLFDRCGTGVPILLKDAGQELAGTPHWVGVAALRDAGVTSRRSTALAQQLESCRVRLHREGSLSSTFERSHDRAPRFRAHSQSLGSVAVRRWVERWIGRGGGVRDGAGCPRL